MKTLYKLLRNGLMACFLVTLIFSLQGCRLQNLIKQKLADNASSSSSSSSGDSVGSCVCPPLPPVVCPSGTKNKSYIKQCSNGRSLSCLGSECEAIGSSSSSGDSGDMPNCTSPCPVGMPAPPICPEGLVNVWFGPPPPPPTLIQPACKLSDGSIQRCFGARMNSKHTQQECRPRCSALGPWSQNTAMDSLDEEVYKAKCGDNSCVIKGPYGELCWESNSPSPQPKTYRPYFDCYKLKPIPACSLGPSRGLIRGDVCQWKESSSLTNCLKTKMEEERAEKLQQFQSNSTFGCKLLNESLSGGRGVLNFECTPSFEQNPLQYCDALLDFARRKLPIVESIRNGTFSSSNGASTRATFRILNARSGDSVKTFPQCEDYFQINPIE